MLPSTKHVDGQDMEREAWRDAAVCLSEAEAPPRNAADEARLRDLLRHKGTKVTPHTDTQTPHKHTSHRHLTQTPHKHTSFVS